MRTTEARWHRRHVLAGVAIALAGCSDAGPGITDERTPTLTPAPTETLSPTETATPTPDGWSVHVSYDGAWQGTVSVTTADGNSHQSFDDEGAKTVNVESQMGVETGAVQDIVVNAEKEASNDATLRVTIRNDGAVVAEGTTDAAEGQVMVSHHVTRDGDTGGTATPTDSPTPTDTPTATDAPTPTEEPTPTAAATPDTSGYSVRFEYDGDWEGTISVTTSEGSSHQAFDSEGTKTVDVEEQLGVSTDEVSDIVVTAQKRASDDQTLHVAIYRDGDVVGEGSTDAPNGQVTVSHHEP